MRLKSLTISRNDYGYCDKEKDVLYGSIEYSGQYGEVKGNLTQQHCAEIIKLVAKAIVATSQDIANNLTAEVLEQSSQALPAPSTQADYVDPL